MKDVNIFSAAIKTWGAEVQTLIVMEEMAELQKELCKHSRGADNRTAIAEEIADVQIMLEQMMILHDCIGLTKAYREEKIKRLEERIKNTSQKEQRK